MRNIISVFTITLFLTLIVCNVSLADDYTKAQETVLKGEFILKKFLTQPNNDIFMESLKRSKAVLLIPQMLKGGFVVGGSGGSGVLLTRNNDDSWSYPVFYTLGSVSVGLQIGAESSEIMMLVMTEKGRDSLLSDSIKLGADATIAAGPVGKGVKAATADILSYANSKGAFGGVSIEGAVVKVKADWNKEYYKSAVSPADILIKQKVINSDADSLRATLKAIASSDINANNQ